MRPLPVTHFTAASALGVGRDAHAQALRDGRSGLVPCRFETVELATWVGEVASLPPLPDALARFDSRNHRLAELALQADGFARDVAACIERRGAARIGIVLGTSTSGILSTEQAYRARDPRTGALPAAFDYATTHNTYALAAYVRERLALAGPALVISTACSSSAKVFATAARWIATGLVDAAVVGGVDSLCLTTLHGFHSLQLTAPGPCRPFDARRDGISIGEAAAFALLEADAPHDERVPRLLGYGESSDAHHMSAPHPQGLGAEQAMRAALARAGLAPEAVDYVNLHGTGTPSNDAAESLAVARVVGTGTPCSSTKGATGHTLGAAGALEAAICLLALERGFIPGGPLEQQDAALAIAYAPRTRAADLRVVLSNSFGFGGSNCALVFGAPPP